MAFPELIAPLLEGQSLSYDEAREVMTFLTGGEATEAHVGAVLTALRIKGATATELAGFVSVMRERLVAPQHGFSDLVDTCGTGGGAPSFNISTASSFVAAAAGVRIAKHGNRGVTSAFGSADVLEAVGAKIQVTEENLLRMLEKTGIGFMFAPAHHPAMKHVGPARKQLGFRTVFNQLGPLSNPLGAKRQLMGVYDPRIAFPIAEALLRLGSERAIIAHGEDGLDEISPCAPTRYALVWDGDLSEGIVTPKGFGLEPLDPVHIQPGQSIEENAALLREAVSEVDSPRCEAILPSAACAIWVAGLEPTRLRAVERARDAVAGGAAREKLEEFVQESHHA